MPIHECKVFLDLASPPHPRTSSLFSLTDTRHLRLRIFLNLHSLPILSFLVILAPCIAPFLIEVDLEYANSQFILWDGGTATRLEGDASTVTACLNIHFQVFFEVWLLIVHMVKKISFVTLRLRLVFCVLKH